MMADRELWALAEVQTRWSAGRVWAVIVAGLCVASGAAIGEVCFSQQPFVVTGAGLVRNEHSRLPIISCAMLGGMIGGWIAHRMRRRVIRDCYLSMQHEAQRRQEDRQAEGGAPGRIGEKRVK